MAEPVRILPADWEPEPAPSADPFRYGYRMRSVRLPSGDVIEEQVPLTPEDLLDPQPGDVVGQSEPHFDLFLLLGDLLRRHYEPREDVYVAGDLKMLWGILGLSQPAPDVAVIPGVRRKSDPTRGSFDVLEEGMRPCLVLEIVSSVDSETRRNDYERKVEIYQQAGIPEYVILDPPIPLTKGRLLLTGHRLGSDGRYHPIAPDAEGRLLSETTGLLFGVEEDGATLVVIDARTGERLRSSSQLEAAYKAELERTRIAEERAAREAEARRAAEAEIARLRAELERARKSPTS